MKLSVIFPVKNQSEKLIKNINSKALPFFDSLGITYDFLIVADASDEKNLTLLKDAIKKMPAQVHLADYEDHPGKGHNVKKGFLTANGDYLLFMDADFATDLNVLKEMLKDINKYDGFIASRHLSNSFIVNPQPLRRRFIGFCSRSLIHLKFLLPYKDTQCGFKMFRRDIAFEMAKRQIIDGFAFDVEYLYFCKLNGFKVKEYPCRWFDDEDSSISSPMKASLQFMKEMRKIKRNKKNYLLEEDTLNNLKKGD